MTNINITTTPTGRSPENKYFFGESTNELCTKRPKYYKTGDPHEYNQFAARMKPTYVNSIDYEFTLCFETAGIRFCVTAISKILIIGCFRNGCGVLSFG